MQQRARHAVVVALVLAMPSAALAQRRPSEDEGREPPSVDAAGAEPSEADAAEPTGDPAPASAPILRPATDVVRLHDGSMARGVISELIVGEHVEMVTVSGATRRFDASEVAYAGPVSDDPGASGTNEGREPRPAPPDTSSDSPASDDGVRPLVTVHDTEAPLQLRATAPNVTFHVRTATAQAGSVSARGYDRICTAPCSASLPSGTYTLALSEGNDDPVEVDELVSFHGPSTLTGKYTSNTGLRVGGWILFGAGSLGGLALTMYGFGADTTEECSPYGDCYETTRPDGAIVALGIATFVVTNVVGLILAFWGDDAEITVE